MYAIVKAGGHQEKVEVGDVILVNRLDAKKGDTVFDTRSASGNLGDLVIVGTGNGRLNKLVKAKLTGPVAERFFDTGALCALLDAHRAGKTNAMTKLWAFYCFIEWYEVYFTGKIPPDL